MSGSTNESTLGESLTVLLLTIPFTVFKVWVLVSLWGWYAVRMGFPPINMAVAYGLLLIISVLTASAKDIKDNKPSTFGESLGNLAGMSFFYAITLLFGWVVQHYI